MIADKKDRLALKQLQKQLMKLEKKEELARMRLRAALHKVEKLGQLLKNRLVFQKELGSVVAKLDKNYIASSRVTKRKRKKRETQTIGL